MLVRTAPPKAAFVAATLVCFGLLLSSTAALAASSKTAPAEELPKEARVVIALTTGDVATVKKRILKSIPMLAEHYRRQGRQLVPVVVIHGEAYRFFLNELDGTPYASDTAVRKEQASLRAALEQLSKEHGVRFEICRAGMNARKLDVKNVYSFVHPVANAVTSLIDWQQRGYAYVPVE